MALQVGLAFGEEILELLPVGFWRDGGPVVGVARRGPQLEQDIVARAVGIGMRAVEVDVAGARSVEAVRVGVLAGVDADHDVAASPGAGRAGIVGLAETGGIELIDERQLDDVAELGAQRGAGKRVWKSEALRGGRKIRLRVDAEGAHGLRRAVIDRLRRAGRHPGGLALGGKARHHEHLGVDQLDRPAQDAALLDEFGRVDEGLRARAVARVCRHICSTSAAAAAGPASSQRWAMRRRGVAARRAADRAIGGGERLRADGAHDILAQAAGRAICLDRTRPALGRRMRGAGV